MLVVDIGAIAGIVIGLVIFVLLVVALLIVCWIYLRRSVTSIFYYRLNLLSALVCLITKMIPYRFINSPE